MRLAAGTLRGRAVKVPPGVRPTGARAREALFDIWGPRLGESRFLDLFAGSGAVGLEALSRGASEVVAVDRAPRVLATLRHNFERLAIDGSWSVRRAVLPRGLAAAGLAGSAAFDLVFADPPYDFADWEALLEAMAPLLGPGGELAIEHGSRNRPPPSAGPLALERQRSYGESELSFYRAEAPGRPFSP